MTKLYDIAIVGGNVVGTIFACLISEHTDLHIAVIDTLDVDNLLKSAGQNNLEYDSRVFAINIASENVFRHLQLWQSIEAMRVSDFQRIEVWEQSSNKRLAFDSADLYQLKLGSIIEQKVILAASYRLLQSRNNVDLYCNRQVSHFNKHPQGSQINFADGNSIVTGLLVGADGNDSIVRQYAGIKNVGWSYNQKGIVATVQTEYSHNKTASQRFLQTGPLAFLPLDNNKSSIVWSVDDLRADELLALDSPAFEQALEKAFEYKLGKTRLISKRYAFPLSLAHSREYTRPGIALAGNSAHTIHPLAGQGVNLGIMDAAVLSEILLAAKNLNKDWKDYRYLRMYERRRKGENLLMMGAMDMFKRTFGSKHLFIRKIAALGLGVASKSGLIQKMVMRQAMGESVDMPVIARAQNK